MKKTMQKWLAVFAATLVMTPTGVFALDINDFVNISDYVNIAPFGAPTPTVNSATAIPETGYPIVELLPGGQTKLTWVTYDAEKGTELTSGGGVMAENNGDVTLTGSNRQVSTLAYQEAHVYIFNADSTLANSYNSAGFATPNVGANPATEPEYLAFNELWDIDANPITGVLDTTAIIADTGDADHIALEAVGFIVDGAPVPEAGGNLTMQGDLQVSGDANVDGTLTAGTFSATDVNATTVTATNVNGTTVTAGTANVTGNLDVDGNTTTDGITNNGTLNNVGMAYTDGLQNDGTLTQNGTLDVNGSGTVSGNLDVDGMVYSDGLQNNGTLANYGQLNNYGSAYVQNNLSVDGVTDTDGLTNNGSFYNYGTAYVSSTLDVDGMAYTDGLQNDGQFNNYGSAYVSGNLSVNGATDTDGLTNNGTFYNYGNSYNYGTAYVQSTLDVDGMAYTDGLQNDGTFTNNGSANINGQLTSDGLHNDGTFIQHGTFDMSTGDTSIYANGSYVNIHVGDESSDIYVDNNEISLSTSGEVVIDAPATYVTGPSFFGDTLVVAPLEASFDYEFVATGGELPEIDNGDGTSTVITQTGTITEKFESISGGGVTLDPNGNATLSKADSLGNQYQYLLVTTFLVDNETGDPIPGTTRYVAGYYDDGEFIEIAERDEFEDFVVSGQDEDFFEGLGAIQSSIPVESAGGNLQVDGNANIDGTLTVGGQNVMQAIADEHVAREAADSAIRADFAAADAALDKKIQANSDRIDQVGAMSAAFSALVPNDRAGGNTQLSLGMGNYEGETAIAAGVFHYFNDKVLVNAGGSFASDETAVRAGVTIGFGK